MPIDIVNHINRDYKKYICNIYSILDFNFIKYIRTKSLIKNDYI